MAGDSEPKAVAAKAKPGCDEADRGSEAEARAAEVAAAIERLRALIRTFGKAPLDEVLASRHEGHKY